MVKKVGETVEKKEKKEKKEKTKRMDFEIVKAICAAGKAVNTDGLLIAVPTNYDPRKYKPLSKSVFAGIPTYLDYQAFMANYRAIQFTKIATDKTAKADLLRKFGDEDTRKKAQKLARLREQIEALQKQLKEEGIDTTNI